MIFWRRLLVISFALLLAGVTLLALSGHRILHAFSANDHSGSIEVDGRTRDYFVHTPLGYDGKSPLPLVFVLHGATQSAESAERMSGMSAKADQENFLAVYPTGTGRLSRVPTWNSGACCGYAMENKVDDVAFFRVLIARLEKDYPWTPAHLFHGHFQWRHDVLPPRLRTLRQIRRDRSGGRRAGYSVPSHQPRRRDRVSRHGRPPRPVQRRQHALSNGLNPLGHAGLGHGRVLGEVRGCSPAPKHEETAEVHTDIYSGCRAGTGVALYAIQGGHHMWPGLRISHNNVPATDLIWAFFKEHPKQ